MLLWDQAQYFGSVVLLWDLAWYFGIRQGTLGQSCYFQIRHSLFATTLPIMHSLVFVSFFTDVNVIFLLSNLNFSLILQVMSHGLKPHPVAIIMLVLLLIYFADCVSTSNKNCTLLPPPPNTHTHTHTHNICSYCNPVTDLGCISVQFVATSRQHL